jgi:16S rRNA processing protein RimM
MTQKEEENDYLIIGKVCKPFGVAGELKVTPQTDERKRFSALSFVYIKRGALYAKVFVENVRYAKDFVILKLEDLDSRDDVSDFTGTQLYIDRENAIRVEESSHYCYDITGCTIVSSKGDSIGTIVDIVNAGSCDVYVVRPINDEEDRVFIPAVKEVVKKIDIDKKEIIIDVIDGLF